MWPEQSSLVCSTNAEKRKSGRHFHEQMEKSCASYASFFCHWMCAMDQERVTVTIDRLWTTEHGLWGNWPCSADHKICSMNHRPCSFHGTCSTGHRKWDRQTYCVIHNTSSMDHGSCCIGSRTCSMDHVTEYACGPRTVSYGFTEPEHEHALWSIEHVLWTIEHALWIWEHACYVWLSCLFVV